MKAALTALLEQVVTTLKKDGVLADDVSVKIVIEHTRDPSHGDFASNLAMMLAKPARQKPRDLAEKIVAALPENNDIEKVEIAGPLYPPFLMQVKSMATLLLAKANVFKLSLSQQTLLAPCMSVMDVAQPMAQQ